MPAELTERRRSKIKVARSDFEARRTWLAPGPFSRLAGDAAQEYLQATRRYGAGMRSLLVILIFFALAEPAAACRRFSIWHYNFPQPPARSIARRPKPRLRRLRQISLARLDRDHLGRNRRRAASCDREVAGSKQRALARRLRLSPMAAQSERWVKRLASAPMARPWTGLGWPFRLGGKENANRNRHRF